jgi:hypothetical protein
VPPEWSQWLKMTRQDPPSEEEMAECVLLPSNSLCMPQCVIRTVSAGMCVGAEEHGSGMIHSQC